MEKKKALLVALMGVFCGHVGKKEPQQQGF